MRSRVEVNIAAAPVLVAELFSDPSRNVEWMNDVERIEALRGNLGEVGSVYKIIPKDNGLCFVATVLAVDLPNRLRLSLDEKTVSVSVNATFVRLSETMTKLISEEQFMFKGLLKRFFSIFVRTSIKRAHRRHIESFKRFAEREQKSFVKTS
jgi:hypothetical protein